MAENDLYSEFEDIANKLSDLSTELSSLKEQLSKSLEENEELKIENKNLRKHLEKVNDGQKDFDPNDLPSSRLNLEKLYEKGFHVCQQFYGSHHDEPCMFCLDVIYGKRSKNH
ncbi:initiation-control protein YabA [Companilactobacillus zhongbaensis]|uniref:initiation-control protein YabA n=1 Tax=Companilactobacillus zhongbaensis TaxID=2486009 RepID=UPI000F774F07|nr:DNA replication initiation control protein YabA [Companilactobacillus zhongbaensis]